MAMKVRTAFGGIWTTNKIKDAVLEILSHITSPKQAYEEAVRLHESEENPYADYTPEELAEMERHEAVLG